MYRWYRWSLPPKILLFSGQILTAHLRGQLGKYDFLLFYRCETERKWLSGGHSTAQWQTWDPHPSPLIPGPALFFRNNQVSLVGILVEFVRAFNRLRPVIGNNRSLNVYFNPHVLLGFGYSQVTRSLLHRSSSSGCLPWSLCFEVQ